MQKARNIILSLGALILVTLVAAYVVAHHSQREDRLLPTQQSIFPWRAYSSTDRQQGGASTIDLRDSVYHLNFDFFLSSAQQYPYVTLGTLFDDDLNPDTLPDWSRYATLRLRVKCRPSNVLSFILHTFDHQVTQRADTDSFRPSVAFFNCGEAWQTRQINLLRLDASEWWLRQHKLNLVNRDYSLRQVKGFSIATSPESPRDTPSNIDVEEIILEGRNWPLIYGAAGLGLLIWGGFFYWSIPQLLRMRQSDEKAGIVTSLNYQPINIDSKQGRERSALLDYLATHYTNPDLSVDSAVTALGMNRTKINDILKEATGLTFATYLNKLRLTEAARLLADKHMGVAEAAFAVGYSSLSYFNRVFKKAYGCTPSSYKNPSPDTSNNTPASTTTPNNT